MKRRCKLDYDVNRPIGGFKRSAGFDSKKGFGQMIAMLSAEFLQSRGAYLRISGRGPEAAAVVAEEAARTDVQWDLRHVPGAEIPSLFRSAACVVLPYERIFTSGVALLAMSVGAMIVGVDLPQLRELLPATSHDYSYSRGDGEAFRRVIDDVLALSRVQRRDSRSEPRSGPRSATERDRATLSYDLS